MKIRGLQRSDYNQVCDLLIEFAHFTKIESFKNDEYDRSPAKNVLLRCEHSGASFVAEDKNKIVGMILSIPVQDLWIPNLWRLRELAWFVNDEYRLTSVGARLYREYVNAAEALRKKGTITGYTMTKLSNSPDFDYERRGFKFVESTYMIGA